MHHVLVIDDEESVSRVLQLGLTKFGYEAKTAARGREGLRLFGDEDFDLVITDIVMPDMDGYEVARHIRGSDRPGTPIIAISGTPWLLENDAFDRVLSKPFSLKTLGEVIKSLVDQTLPSQTDACCEG
jgi:DNA-binding response OmpR family regulator